MFKYLILLMAAIPLLAKAEISCHNDPIYCKIVTVKPTVDKKFAATLSRAITRYSKKFGTDPMLSIAIAMQESSLQNKNRIGRLVTPEGLVVRGITDIGVFQLHVDTIAYLQSKGAQLDVSRLKTDIDYQTYWHVKILKSKIKTCENLRRKLDVVEGNEWACYHSFTPSKRKIYLKDVRAHLTKIEKF